MCVCVCVCARMYVREGDGTARSEEKGCANGQSVCAFFLRELFKGGGFGAEAWGWG